MVKSFAICQSQSGSMMDMSNHNSINHIYILCWTINRCSFNAHRVLVPTHRFNRIRTRAALPTYSAHWWGLSSAFTCQKHSQLTELQETLKANWLKHLQFATLHFFPLLYAEKFNKCLAAINRVSDVISSYHIYAGCFSAILWGKLCKMFVILTSLS